MLKTLNLEESKMQREIKELERKRRKKANPLQRRMKLIPKKTHYSPARKRLNQKPNKRNCLPYGGN